MCAEVEVDVTKEIEKAIFQKETKDDKDLSYFVCSYNSSNYSLLTNNSPAYKSYRNENENQEKVGKYILLGKSTIHKNVGLNQYNTTKKREKIDGKTNLKKNNDPSTNTQHRKISTNQTTQNAPTDEPT